MKRNERRRMARKQALPVEQQKSSTWWEGTEDMAPFPPSHDMMCSHDHTIHEHTLRSTRCPIATYDSPREDPRTRLRKLRLERRPCRSFAPGTYALRRRMRE